MSAPTPNGHSANSSVRAPEPTLAELMRGLGRRIPFMVSLAICGTSVVALASVLLVWPSRWKVALALTAAGAFGAWIVADHERYDRGTADGPLWQWLQGISGFLGVAAVFVLLLGFLGSALGLWVS